ncbi:MAG: uracil-DNA glycosylase [Pseudomonadota bacterium]
MGNEAVLEPPRDCNACPRLTEFRRENASAYPDWFNGAVPSFGDDQAKLLIVGLAPGLQGANKTGRPFTGDFAGDLLYATLEKFGLSTGKYSADPEDGLRLKGAMITNAVRCVPPQNKPTTAEIKTCAPYLDTRLRTMKSLRAVICLGKIAHDSVVRSLGLPLSRAKFGHGAAHAPDGVPFKIFDSYHCSRYNTNTGRLTPEMFHHVFDAVTRHLSST